MVGGDGSLYGTSRRRGECLLIEAIRVATKLTAEEGLYALTRAATACDAGGDCRRRTQMKGEVVSSAALRLTLDAIADRTLPAAGLQLDA